MRSASPKWGVCGTVRPQNMELRRGVPTMKRSHQMSLIVRRAQIRRAAASRKGAPPAPTSIRPLLRLVASNDNRLKAASGFEARSQPFE